MEQDLVGRFGSLCTQTPNSLKHIPWQNSSTFNINTSYIWQNKFKVFCIHCFFSEGCLSLTHPNHVSEFLYRFDESWIYSAMEILSATTVGTVLVNCIKKLSLGWWCCKFGLGVDCCHWLAFKHVGAHKSCIPKCS